MNSKSVSAPANLASQIDVTAIVFALTTFCAALLLFLLEPMFAKMVLPRLGGSSEVWTACVLFYQVTLLAGYAYANLIQRLRRVRDQALVHGIVCALAAVTLPLTVPATSHPSFAATATFWLLRTLLVTAGPPLFALSATSPLMQAWFALARPGRSPYPLYAASNFGSLVALMLYPFAIEPVWGLHTQSIAWALAFASFALLLGLCAIAARRATSTAAGAPRAALPITWPRRLRWIAWAFIPSSLMLSVTTYLSERVAPIPLIWTLPLGLYLASFVVVFATRAKRRIDFANRYAPLVLLPLVVVLSFRSTLPIPMEITLHLVVFAAIALVCHGAIARDRPDASQLTEFYVFVALGGVFGGAFNSVIAPMIFSDVFEYPIVLVLACFALAPRNESARAADPRLDYLLPLVLAALISGLLYMSHALPSYEQAIANRVVVGSAAVAVFSFVARPLRFGLGVAAILFVAALRSTFGGELHVERNFYGVKQIVAVNSTVRALLHGHTIHGAEDFAPERERIPLTYFSRTGPLGDIFRIPLGARPAVAVIGLGAGSTACYRQREAAWTFYEIDPGVIAIARNPRFFRYLAHCAPDSPVVAGDGRLSLAAALPQAYNLIVLDAYASDAIPTHLLTREAMHLYVSRLRPHGLIAFHISNLYFDFAPLISALAGDSGMIARGRIDEARGGGASFILGSRWMVVGHNVSDLGPVARDARWTITRAARRVWTDDYSSIMTVLRGRL